MARRVRSAGDYLPELADGILAHAEWLDSGFDGIDAPGREALLRGDEFTIAVTSIWIYLFHAASPAHHRYLVVARDRPEVEFVYDPTSFLLKEIA